MNPAAKVREKLILTDGRLTGKWERGSQLLKNRDSTQYKKAPTFAVG